MAATPAQFEVTFCGTSTMHVTDGATSFLVDGFFTRPSLLRVAVGRIAPDRARIEDGLRRAGVRRLDALFVAHSHYDHALDAPDVVRLAGGTLYGSESTLNVGRGGGLGEDRLSLVVDDDVVQVGDFTIRVLEARHSPGDRFPGTIEQPLTPPARASAYRTGPSLSFLVEHPQGSMLIYPSAGFIPNRLDGVQADLLYLGVGALGAQGQQYQDDYWRHVVTATKPKLIIPVHWDNLTGPLTHPLRPLPPPLDRPGRTLKFLIRRAGEARIPWHFQGAFETIRPFG